MVKMIKKLMHDAIINIQTELHSCLSYAVVLMRQTNDTQSETDSKISKTSV